MRCLYLLVFVLYFMQTYAQFTQRGKTLEYNGRNSKTTYKSPISISFQGCSSTNNDKKGNLSLIFPTAKAGNVVSCTGIEISNPEYVIFNRNDFDIWTLGERDLSIILCKKSKIDQYVAIYTKVQMDISTAKYEAKVKELKESKQYADDLENKLKFLEAEHYNEIKEIKANALIFAYIDEERLDSLQYEQYQCILNNDIEGAVRIGKQIDFKNNISKQLSNFEKSVKKTQEIGLKLYKETEALYLHLANCELLSVDKDSIKTDYEILMKSYRSLIEQYPNNFKCTDSIYQKTKLKLGNIIYNYTVIYHNTNWNVKEQKDYNVIREYMKEAAFYKNSKAILWMAEYGEDRCECQTYAKQLFEGIKNGTLNYPEEYYSFYDIKDMCTSIPDFKIEEKSIVYYYNYLNDCEVSLVHAHCKDSTLSEIIIPEKITYQGKRLVVTEIGACAFGEESYFSSLRIGYKYVEENDRGNNFYPNSRIRLSIPNSITYVGAGAFDSRLSATFLIKKIPEELKVLRERSFYCCSFKSSDITIPNRVERIEKDALPLYNDISENNYELSMPFSLKELETLHGISGGNGDNAIAKIIDINNNPNFRIIDGALYNADSSFVYIGTLGQYNKRLNITRNLKFDDEDFLYKLRFTDIDSIIFDNRNPYYAYYEHCLYTKNLDTLLYILPSAKRVKLSYKIKSIDVACFPSDIIYEIPNNITIEGLCTCIETFSSDICFELYGKKYKSNYDIEMDDENNKIELLNRIIKDNNKNAKLLCAVGLFYLENDYYYQACDLLDSMSQATYKHEEYYTLLFDSCLIYKNRMDKLIEEYQSLDGYNHNEIIDLCLKLKNYFNKMANYLSTETAIHNAFYINWVLGAQEYYIDNYRSSFSFLKDAIPYSMKLIDMFGLSKYGKEVSNFYTLLAYVAVYEDINQSFLYAKKAQELDPNNMDADEILRLITKYKQSKNQIVVP